MAGRAVAQGDNGIGTLGVCYDCDLIMSAAFSYNNIKQLAIMGYRVFNMSWGGFYYSQTRQDFITEELIEDHDVIEMSDVSKALALLDIDNLGLDSMDRKILTVMRDYYSCGPVGIDALSATLGEDKQTIEEVYEPFLLKEGLLLRTPRGRVLSEKSIQHIS